MTYNPWLDAAERYPEIHIEWQAIAPVQAAWSPRHNVILVDRSLTKIERRCALAHEIAHIDAGDRSTEACWFATRQETFADRLAAERLVHLDDLLAVARWCGTNGEAADALDVTLDVLVLRSKTMCDGDRRRVAHTLALRELVA